MHDYLDPQRYKPLKTGHKDKTRVSEGEFGMTELLLGGRELSKLSWMQTPKPVLKAILEEYKQKALAHKKAPINVMANYEERAWAMWGNLQQAHSID